MPVVFVVVVVCLVTMTTPNLQTGGQEVSARFAAGGHDAEAYGASAGYPTGDRTTFKDVGSLVGSHSHLDEIFPSRLIRNLASRELLGLREQRIGQAVRFRRPQDGRLITLRFLPRKYRSAQRLLCRGNAIRDSLGVISVTVRKDRHRNG